MNKKVVVMSGADVAAMRKAHKEAEKAYFEAKVGALEYAVEEMRETGREYSLTELRDLTGLSSMELVAQLCGGSGNCKAACKAGINHGDIYTTRKETIRKYAEIMPSGDINPNSVISVKRVETAYRMPGNRHR